MLAHTTDNPAPPARLKLEAEAEADAPEPGRRKVPPTWFRRKCRKPEAEARKFLATKI